MPVLDPARLADPSSNDEVLDAFLSYLIDEGIEAYDHQEEALLELFAGSNVILNTPTGSRRRGVRQGFNSLTGMARFRKSR